MHSVAQEDVLPFQLASANIPGNGIRHLLLNRKTGFPMPAASLYEVNLAQRSGSYNTCRTALYNLAYLYSWAFGKGIDLDELLLLGRGLSRPHIRSFAAWLRNRNKTDSGQIALSKRTSINAKLQSCSAACVWFINQFATSPGISHREIETQILANSQKKAWTEAKLKSPRNNLAPDLTEQEISEIEAFLNPENHHRETNKDLAFRDYLFWRMAIEFGMRLGEILAMRISDCPSRNAPYFRIVRIEERGEHYHDPREKPPRPKTLSRDLGFLFDNTRFPHLVSNYITEHRLPWIWRHGKRVRKLILPHNFLITAQNGAPLSIRSAHRIAKDIREGTGINFYWHIARHAFFNRAYSEIATITNREEYRAKFDDLIWWGGWSNPDSLNQYIRRARADRARTPLRILQNGARKWIALN
ncbi:MAG: site-specific integrase [Marinobacter sp.]|jgi:integrase|nr:site-specific integrase [Marinobacter sp.]MCL1484264.1 site-specific integrase [Marinobacter sp.]